MTPYRFLPHTADIKVELTASDVPGLYQASVDAVRELLVGEGPSAASEARSIALEGAAEGDRLVAFLRELVYLYDVERFIPVEVTLTSTGRAGGGVTVQVRGERFSSGRHRAQRELKGVTYHGLVFEQRPGSARAVVIFDV